MSQIEKLKNRIFNRGGKQTIITRLLAIAREFGCLSDLVGREFEVYDKNNKLVYTIKQKPLTINQTNLIMDGLINLKKIDNESIKKSGSGRRFGR
jgi:hypothetical protein